jgi:tRNA modification GTPase
VLGVIDAYGQDELDAALVQLAGGLARPLNVLRNDLLQLLAELEAGLDFVDEDIEFIAAEEVVARLESAEQILEEVAAKMRSRETAGRLRRVAFVGRPNAGKSSLFNALVALYGEQIQPGKALPAAAIVSSKQGTTRDYLVARVSLGGIECELVDTAGVGEGHEERSAAELGVSSEIAIDIAAKDAARQRRREADVRLLCVDITEETSSGDLPSIDADRDVLVLTKADLAPADAPDSKFPGALGIAHVVTSSRTGKGLDELAAILRAKLLSGDSTGGAVAATAERCRESVWQAVGSIARARELAAPRSGDELVAAEIRSSLDELGKVVGAIYTDDLLDRIFSTFCIGK